MIKLKNENILKLIFSTMSLQNLIRILNIMGNAKLNRIIMRILSFKNLFTTIGKSRAFLGLHKSLNKFYGAYFRKHIADNFG
jgi:hypothetical protein